MPSASPRPNLARLLWRDRLLLSAVAACMLLIGYYLVVILHQPAWSGMANDWLRAALAWSELLVVAYISWWLSRARRPQALSWWLFCAALLCHAIAWTWWIVDNQFVYHHKVPFPSASDPIFALQYLFFSLAVILIPRTRFWGPRLIMVLDGLLFMGAAVALSWHFILVPIYVQSGLSPLARVVSLAYPVGDLFVLFALTMSLLRPLRYAVDRPVAGILVVAFACLIVADAWAMGRLAQPGYVYRAGGVHDVFRLAFYLLLTLAALVQLRVAQRTAPWNGEMGETAAAYGPSGPGPQWQDVSASLRLFLPIVAALLASAVLMIHATFTAKDTGWRGTVTPLALGCGLLLLVILRQGITFLENARLRRENEVARANEQALRELNRRKDEFLGVVSHEIRTPLASLQGYIQLLAHRFDALRPQEDSAERLARLLALARTALVYCEEGLRRLIWLANDLTDDARIREGRLDVHLASCDLSTIVRTVVEEQRALAPDRAIHLILPGGRPASVVADAERIRQVVTNYLSNALKYSKAERPVTVRLEVEGDGTDGADGADGADADGDRVRVAVSDEGPGLSLADQARVWERFPRIAGVTVQSGSGVSLGIGLYISKRIVEGHHGQVGVESALGQGSTFWFTLPLAPPAP